MCLYDAFRGESRVVGVTDVVPVFGFASMQTVESGNLVHYTRFGGQNSMFYVDCCIENVLLVQAQTLVSIAPDFIFDRHADEAVRDRSTVCSVDCTVV